MSVRVRSGGRGGTEASRGRRSLSVFLPMRSWQGPRPVALGAASARNSRRGRFTHPRASTDAVLIHRRPEPSGTANPNRLRKTFVVAGTANGANPINGISAANNGTASTATFVGNGGNCGPGTCGWTERTLTSRGGIDYSIVEAWVVPGTGNWPGFTCPIIGTGIRLRTFTADINLRFADGSSVNGSGWNYNTAAESQCGGDTDFAQVHQNGSTTETDIRLRATSRSSTPATTTTPRA